jgi:hypothetical protein
MNSNLRDNISKMLQATEEIKKTITINLDEKLVDKVDKISKIFSQINPSKNFSRNSIIEIAINSFIVEATDLLAHNHGINVEAYDIENQTPSNHESSFDLVTFPAHELEFNRIFIGEKQWYSVRISEEKVPFIKYVALYVGSPVSGITHYGKVSSIVPSPDDEKKKMIILEDVPTPLSNTIKLGDTNANAMRAPRYTTLQKLLNAKVVADLFK